MEPFMRYRSVMFLAAVMFAMVPAARAQKVDVEVFTLDNGMKFLLVPRHDAPNSIAAGWLARVGSVNERPGITGISHFFEHMMFKGTHVIGTRDIQADLKIIEEQEQVREQMRQELEVMRGKLRRGEIADLTSPESQTDKYRELDKKFDELVKRQRET